EGIATALDAKANRGNFAQRHEAAPVALHNAEVKIRCAKIFAPLAAAIARTVSSRSVVQHAVAVLVINAILCFLALITTAYWRLDVFGQVPLPLHFKQAARAQTIFPKVFLLLDHDAPAVAGCVLFAGQNFGREVFSGGLAGILVGALVENVFQRRIEADEPDKLCVARV